MREGCARTRHTRGKERKAPVAEAHRLSAANNYPCASPARFTADREVARELRRMALEYQYKAAALDNGKLPDVGLPTSMAQRKIAGSGAAE